MVAYLHILYWFVKGTSPIKIWIAGVLTDPRYGGNWDMDTRVGGPHEWWTVDGI